MSALCNMELVRLLVEEFTCTVQCFNAVELIVTLGSTRPSLPYAFKKKQLKKNFLTIISLHNVYFCDNSTGPGIVQKSTKGAVGLCYSLSCYTA
jgi:hypothetical protein